MLKMQNTLNNKNIDKNDIESDELDTDDESKTVIQADKTKMICIYINDQNH